MARSWHAHNVQGLADLNVSKGLYIRMNYHHNLKKKIATLLASDFDAFWLVVNIYSKASIIVKGSNMNCVAFCLTLFFYEDQ